MPPTFFMIPYTTHIFLMPYISHIFHAALYSSDFSWWLLHPTFLCCLILPIVYNNDLYLRYFPWCLIPSTFYLTLYTSNIFHYALYLPKFFMIPYTSYSLQNNWYFPHFHDALYPNIFHDALYLTHFSWSFIPPTVYLVNYTSQIFNDALYL